MATDPAADHAQQATALARDADDATKPWYRDPRLIQLATTHATLAVAAEQRTANLIAEAGRLTHALVHADELLEPGHRDRIAGVLEQIHHLVHDRLNLTPEAAPTQVMPTQVMPTQVTS